MRAEFVLVMAVAVMLVVHGFEWVFCGDYARYVLWLRGCLSEAANGEYLLCRKQPYALHVPLSWTLPLPVCFSHTLQVSLPSS